MLVIYCSVLVASKTKELHCGTCGGGVKGECWCQIPVTGYVSYNHAFSDWYSGLSVFSAFRAETFDTVHAVHPLARFCLPFLVQPSGA